MEGRLVDIELTSGLVLDSRLIREGNKEDELEKRFFMDDFWEKLRNEDVQAIWDNETGEEVKRMVQ